jgi:hypothetical protein
MIKFSLICQSGHEFESWFQNSSAFETQIEAQLLQCPHCQSVNIGKAIMAPAVTNRRTEVQGFAPQQDRELPAVTSKTPVPAPHGSPPGPLLDAEALHMRQMIQSFHQKLNEEAVDVGFNFSKEARRIHEGKSPERLIFGQASFEDAKALIEDGIGILPIPPLPEDLN